MTVIGEGAFSGCGSLEILAVENGNGVYSSAGNCIIEISRGALVAGCKNSAIPDDGSVVSIDSYAFSGCEGLIKITVPDSVSAIKEFAFSGCGFLENVTFVNTQGWKLIPLFSSDASDISDISSSDLANSATAAKYLTTTYSDYYWKRG